METTIKNHEVRVNLTQTRNLILNMLATERLSGVRQTPILEGPPGNGKTAIVGDICRELDELDRKQGGPGWELVSFRLSQCDPTDLKGVPVYDKIGGVEVCTYAPPKIFPLIGIPESADGKNVLLFLDELKQATPVIQQLAANIIDGRIGDYNIDLSRCFIVAAGNRKEDMAATFDVPRNVVSRVVWLSVVATFGEWENWAIENQLHPHVISYLKDNTTVFNQQPPAVQKPYGTPRTWHKVSCYMNYMGESWFDDDLSLIHLIGCVGGGTAHDFKQFCATANEKFNVTALFDGTLKKVPDNKSMLFSLILQSCYRLNNWAEETQTALANEFHKISSNTELDEVSKNDQKAELIVKYLGEKRIESINNVYSYVDKKEVDPAFSMLMNRYQNATSYSIYKYAIMTRPELKEAKKAYLHLHEHMSGQANNGE